jgi:UDP-N-acetylmuramyl pentapeptide phosphotransferase/UDP-N-acetylglucosamine-1-phosphate transferase
MIASVVFLFFNFRKRARCFAGDVGSVAIAFWIVTLLLLLIIKTENLIWLGFLMGLYMIKFPMMHAKKGVRYVD